MRFLLLVEEQGFQFRYWNEMTQEIGPIIASSWDRNELYNKLKNKQFNIDRHTFSEAIRKVEIEEKPFVILKTNDENKDSIDLFMKDTFSIEGE